MLSIKVQHINLEASAEYKSEYNGINHLKPIHKINLSKLVIAHLNITLVRNTFEALIQNVSGEIDLLMISQTKIDESIPKSQFLIKDFGDPFRTNQNIHVGGILLYVREDIFSKLLSTKPKPSECFSVKLYLCKQK